MNLQLPLVISKKSISSDMHQRITNMSINFQQNRVSRSVKTGYTNIFAKYRKLRRFVTCNMNFVIKLLSDMHNPNLDM